MVDISISCSLYYFQSTKVNKICYYLNHLWNGDMCGIHKNVKKIAIVRSPLLRPVSPLRLRTEGCPIPASACLLKRANIRVAPSFSHVWNVPFFHDNQGGLTCAIVVCYISHMHFFVSIVHCCLHTYKYISVVTLANVKSSCRSKKSKGPPWSSILASRIWGNKVLWNFSLVWSCALLFSKLTFSLESPSCMIFWMSSKSVDFTWSASDQPQLFIVCERMLHFNASL